MSVTSVIVALLGSILTMLVMLAGTIRWLWRQAQGQQRQTDATERNTAATEKLSESFKTYAEKADGHLLDHEKRITRLEAR